jgi:hypothetical protein
MLQWLIRDVGGQDSCCHGSFLVDRCNGGSLFLCRIYIIWCCSSFVSMLHEFEWMLDETELWCCSGDFHSLLPVVFKHFSVFFLMLQALIPCVANVHSWCCNKMFGADDFFPDVVIIKSICSLKMFLTLQGLLCDVLSYSTFCCFLFTSHVLPLEWSCGFYSKLALFLPLPIPPSIDFQALMLHATSYACYNVQSSCRNCSISMFQAFFQSGVAFQVSKYFCCCKWYPSVETHPLQRQLMPIHEGAQTCILWMRVEKQAQGDAK